MSLEAEKFFNSENVQRHIQGLGGELRKCQESITSIRPPQSERVESYSKAIDYLQGLRGRNLFYPYLGSGMGHGPYVELQDGSVKLDLINGIGIHLMGHSHPELIATAMRAALSDTVMQGNLQPNQEYADLLDTLLKSAGRGSRLRKGWIGTCGTIVNENALKIVRQKNSPARKILAFENRSEEHTSELQSP